MATRPTDRPPEDLPAEEIEYDETPTGNHRVLRDGTRMRRDADSGGWVEVDEEPSNADQAGRAVGEFLGGMVDGIRRRLSIPAVIALATTFGAVGGAGGSMVFGETPAGGPSATPAQVEMLVAAIGDLNMHVARVEARLNAHIQVGAHADTLLELEKLSINVSNLSRTVEKMRRDAPP